MNPVKNLFYVVCIFSFLILFSCGSTSKIAQAPEKSGDDLPGWVTNPHRFYPKELYIVGVGTGDTRSAAENNAVGNIARVFMSDIKVDQTIVENFLETESAQGDELSVTTEILRKSSVGSQQKLKNIKVEKTHFSSTDGLYYVLAYLDRAETEAYYREDIEKNNQKIREYYGYFQSNPNKLNKFAFLSKAKTITAVNDYLQQQLQIISMTGEEVPPAVPESQLNSDLRALLDQITVNLQPAESSAPQVTDYMKETIGKIGFKIVDGPADFTFDYGLEMSPTDLKREDAVAYNWKMTVQVRDNINNYALKAFNLQDRTVAISEGEVRSRILTKVRSRLLKDFHDQFLAYINSL